MSESERGDRKKRPRREESGRDKVSKKVRRFFEEEAGEASEDEDDEEEDTAERRDVRQRELERLRKEVAQRKHAGSHRLKSVIERIEERAKDEAGNALVPVAGEDEGAFLDEEGYDSEAGLEEDGVARMPTLEDDKLFLVRTTEPGKERIVIAQLTTKAAELTRAGQHVPVRSFFCTDSLRGFIYVEAPSESSVRTFITGIRRIQAYSVKIVPFREQLGVFKTAVKAGADRFAPLQPGEWVKVKRHPLYHGDLARVHADNFDDFAEILLVPRLGKSVPPHRPNPAFFDASAVEQLGLGEVERIRNSNTGQVYLHYQGERYTDDGYLLKRFNKNSLLTGAEAAPTQLELNRFLREAPSANQLAALPTAKAAGGFRLGDSVSVVATDLKGIKGSIIAVDADRDRVTIQDTQTQRKLEFSFDEVAKIFKSGDHVKILSGAEEGETGIVSKFAAGRAYVVLDGSLREVIADAQMMQLSGEVSKGEISIMGVTVGDLVSIRGGELSGVVIRLSKSGNMVLLGSDGNKHQSNAAEVAGLPKINQRGVFGVSRHGDSFGIDSTVKIISTGEIGNVKYLHKNIAFVKIRNKSEDGGFFIAPAKDVEVIVSQDGRNKDQFPQRPAPRVTPAPNQRSQQMSVADKLMGSRVRIIRGTFKGYVATVRDVQDSKVQVSLEAKFKIVTLPKDHIRSIEAEDEDDCFAPAPVRPAGTTSALAAGPPSRNNLNNPPARVLEPMTPAAQFLPASPDDDDVGVQDSVQWWAPGVVIEVDGARAAIVRLEGGDTCKVRMIGQNGVFKSVRRADCKTALPSIGDTVKVMSGAAFAGLTGELLGFQTGAKGDQDDAIILSQGDVKVCEKKSVALWAS